MGQIGYLSPVPGGAWASGPSKWFRNRVVNPPNAHGVPLWADASVNPMNAINNLVTAPVPANVLVASTTPALQAAVASNAARVAAGQPPLPIVAVGVADYAQLLQPNVTGVASLTLAASVALAEILAVAFRGIVNNIAVVREANPSKQAQAAAILGIAPGLGVAAVDRPVPAGVNWANEFNAIRAAGYNGAIVLSSPQTVRNAPAIVAAANGNVPRTIFGGDGFGGGLMSYGPNRRDVYRLAADLAVQICRGGAPPPEVAPNRLTVSIGTWGAVVGGAIPARIAGHTVYDVHP